MNVKPKPGISLSFAIDPRFTNYYLAALDAFSASVVNSGLEFAAAPEHDEMRLPSAEGERETVNFAPAFTARRNVDRLRVSATLPVINDLTLLGFSSGNGEIVSPLPLPDAFNPGNHDGRCSCCQELLGKDTVYVFSKSDGSPYHISEPCLGKILSPGHFTAGWQAGAHASAAMAQHRSDLSLLSDLANDHHLLFDEQFTAANYDFSVSPPELTTGYGRAYVYGLDQTAGPQKILLRDPASRPSGVIDGESLIRISRTAQSLSQGGLVNPPYNQLAAELLEAGWFADSPFAHAAEVPKVVLDDELDYGSAQIAVSGVPGFADGLVIRSDIGVPADPVPEHVTEPGVAVVEHLSPVAETDPPQPDSRPDEPAGATDINAIVRKQIPDMTVAEIEQAIAHYGPDHKRTAKLNREIAKRGITTQQQEQQANGIEATQTKQASKQRTQAPAEAGAHSEPVDPAVAAESAIKASEIAGINLGIASARQGVDQARSVARAAKSNASDMSASGRGRKITPKQAGEIWDAAGRETAMPEPDFVSGETRFGTSGGYDKKTNKVYLNIDSKEFRNIDGYGSLTPRSVVLHEIGHWGLFNRANGDLVEKLFSWSDNASYDHLEKWHEGKAGHAFPKTKFDDRDEMVAETYAIWKSGGYVPAEVIPHLEALDAQIPDALKSKAIEFADQHANMLAAATANAAAEPMESVSPAISQPVDPGTRLNGEQEEAAASRLRALVDDLPAALEPRARAGRSHVESCITELERPRTATPVIALLETASQHFFAAGYVPASEVIDRVIDSLDDAVAEAEQAVGDVASSEESVTNPDIQGTIEDAEETPADHMPEALGTGDANAVGTVAPPHDSSKSTASPVQPGVFQHFEGRWADINLASGDVAITLSGRETTPFPAVDTSTPRKASNSFKRAQAWLFENVIAEAEARGDQFNVRMFRDAAKSDIASQSDISLAEMYLFEDQPPVLRPLGTLIVDPAEALDAALTQGLQDEIPAGPMNFGFDFESQQESQPTESFNDDRNSKQGRLQPESVGQHSSTGAVGDLDRESLDAGLAGPGRAPDKPGNFIGSSDRSDSAGDEDPGREPHATPVTSGVADSDGGGSGSAVELNADGNQRTESEEVATPALIDGQTLLEELSALEADDSDEEGADFTLDDVEIGSGGLKTKARRNILAIRTLKTIEAQGRSATHDERRALALYSGWGALKGAFDPSNTSYADIHHELNDLLTADEYAAARASTLNAHYTSRSIIQYMYKALEKMGFKGGTLLEPSIGTGNFVGLMPNGIRSNSDIFGVELDDLTSRIVSKLYPSIRVAQNTGFQNYNAPKDFFDVAIGNPPFGSEPIIDKELSDYSGWSIHNYFFGKSIDLVRPNGLFAMVVSNAFLDARNDASRKWIAARADLVSAVRLPNTAFKANAGTEVVTDIIILQKREELRPADEDLPDWVQSSLVNFKDYDEDGTEITGDVWLNSYYRTRKSHILGVESLTGSMYRANTYTVNPLIGTPLETSLEGWLAEIPEAIYTPGEARTLSDLDTGAKPDAMMPEAAKVGSYFVRDSVIYQRVADVFGEPHSIIWNTPNMTAMKRMVGMIAIRDGLKEQLRLEGDTEASSAAIESHRAKLNSIYDRFVKAFGYLNDGTNRRIFYADPESPLIQALEFDYRKPVGKAEAAKFMVQESPSSATKADIFYRRIVRPVIEIVSADNAKDAFIASLKRYGRVDMDYITSIYPKSVEVIREELVDVLIEAPDGQFVMLDEYLSGDVKTKLAEAMDAAAKDHRFALNVEKLKAVIPVDKKPSQIFVSLGAHFVKPAVYEEFLHHLCGAKTKFIYSPARGEWMIHEVTKGDARSSTVWGTKSIQTTQLIERIIRGRGVVIMREENFDGKIQMVVDRAATEAAQEKAERIKEEWSKWIWTDPDRTATIVDEYNSRMNRIVLRKSDGQHLEIGSGAITLEPSQKDAIWRAILDRATLLDHCVGAGKTFIMIGAAMEKRRLNLVRRPLVAVPNHLTLQFRDEVMRLYPEARVLVSDPSDFERSKRKVLFSKIVTGDWDMIIIGHSQLKKLASNPEFEADFVQRQVDGIIQEIVEAKRHSGERTVISQLERTRKTLEARFSKIQIKLEKERDSVIRFDELGVDMLIIDELHEFKNLFYSTSMERVAGMGNPTGSDKAFDLYLKVMFLLGDQFGNEGHLLTATATPMSNSLVEMYTMLRYHMPDTLEAMGIDTFSSWASQFASVESVYEVNPSGTGFRQSTRLGKFKNLQTLMTLYQTFADMVTVDDLKANAIAKGKVFPVPEMTGGAPINVVVPRSPFVAQFMGIPSLMTDEFGRPEFEVNINENTIIDYETTDTGQVVILTSDKHAGDDEERATVGLFADMAAARRGLVELAMTPLIRVDENSILGQFDRLTELTRATNGKINALSLTNQANKAALDIRLIDPHVDVGTETKVNYVADRVIATYKNWRHELGTQIIFCNQSIPRSAKAANASKGKAGFIREANGAVKLLNVTLHTLPGGEEMPLFVRAVRGKDEGTIHRVFDAMTGKFIGDYPSQSNPWRSAMEAVFADEAKRDALLSEIESGDPISEEERQEYFQANNVDTDNLDIFDFDDLVGGAGDNAFTVYDEIKRLLIEGGIKEEEIAFIHDYPTPAAKAMLFRRVNSGEVAVVMSTDAKMGAGTNVQKRIVALHNVDAPWRPDLLEQRIGRAIRQGNDLFDKYRKAGVDFTVSIYNYATERTYDTRRWQLIEHKARTIAQVRKYDGVQNEIDDISDTTASAEDMKTAASGDPLILLDTKLKNEARRLDLLHQAFIDDRRLSYQRVKCIPDEITKLRSKIEELTELQEVADNFPDDIYMNVAGRDYEKPADAYKAITNRFYELVRLKNSHRQGSFEMTAKGVTYEMGISPMGGFYLDGPGVNTAMGRDNDTEITGRGIAMRVFNAVGRISAEILKYQEDIERSSSRLEYDRKIVEQPFEHAKTLEFVRAMHDKVKRAMLAKGPELDPAQEEVKIKALSERQALLRKLGFGPELDEIFSAGEDSETMMREVESKLAELASGAKAGTSGTADEKSIELSDRDSILAYVETIQKDDDSFQEQVGAHVKALLLAGTEEEDETVMSAVSYLLNGDKETIVDVCTTVIDGLDNERNARFNRAVERMERLTGITYAEQIEDLDEDGRTQQSERVEAGSSPLAH